MSDKWKLIVEVHQYTKELLTLAEEISPSLKTFIPPVKEQRDALEHIIRAKAFEIELQDVDNPKYIDEQINKTLGHIYRAFFDVADYFCILMRDEITNLLSDFDSNLIKLSIPTFYTKIRPLLENINREISELRKAKDIAKNEGLIIEVEKYRVICFQLSEFTSLIKSKISDINQLKESIHYIKKVSTELIGFIDSYDTAIIDKVIPNYYSEIRPQLDILCNQFHDIEKSKKELNEINSLIKSKKPTIDSLKSKKRFEDIMKFVYGGAGTLTLYIIGRFIYESIFPQS